MFHLWSGRVSTSHLSTIRTLVLHHTAAFLVLTHCSRGQSQMVGSSKPIFATVDDDIMLPCHLETATDVVAKTLEWARLDLTPRFVHLRRDGVELLVNQNPSYIGRTSVSMDRLKHGDISLKLSKVKVSDEGKYRCLVPGLGTSEVHLVVGALSSPVVIIAGIDEATRGVMLDCRSEGWYPEPEVLWLDGEGNLLSAGPPETVRGPDDLYTVSSRVTVEKRHSNSFTCRVHQKNTNQTRENHICILDDVFSAPSCSAVRIIVILSVCVLFSCISATLVVFWKHKQKQSKHRNEMHHGNETNDGTGERDQLLKGRTTTDLDEKEEEHKVMLHMISVLMEHKKELELSRDKRISQLEKVKEEMKKNDKKLEKLNVNFSWNENSKKSSLLEEKMGLDKRKTKYEESLSTIKERLQKTEEVIQTLTDRKKKVENQMERIKKEVEESKRRREEVEMQLQSEREEENIKTDSLMSSEDHPSSHPDPQ